MRATLTFAAVTVLLGLGLGAVPAHAACKRFGFTVNDYGKEGPIRDAKELLDKHIAEWAAKNGVKNYTTGKKDVSCELFLNFILFDEHTCTATASVCWGEDQSNADGNEAAAKKGSPPAPEQKADAESDPAKTADDATAEKADGPDNLDKAGKVDKAETAGKADKVNKEAYNKIDPTENVVTPIERATAGSTPITFDPAAMAGEKKPAESPSKSAKSPEMAEPAQSAEPTNAAESETTAGTADMPLGPAKAQDPVKTVEPAKTIEPVKPLNPVRTVEPAKAVDTMEEKPADTAPAVEAANPLNLPASKSLEAIESAYQKPPATPESNTVETGTLGLHSSPASAEKVMPAPPMTEPAVTAAPAPPPPAVPGSKDRAAAAAAAAAAATAAEKAAAAAETAAAAAKEAAAAAVAASAASRGAVVPPLETSPVADNAKPDRRAR